MSAAIVPPIVIQELKRRFQGFRAPAGLFDPTAASEPELREVGLPPRPGHPLLRQVWERGFGAPLRLQQFRVDQRLVEAADYRPQTRRSATRLIAETRFETSPNWAGAYITANQGKQFLQVWGVWTIPAKLAPPPQPFQGRSGIPYVCANWIGLDGQRRYFDSSLPQIGTSSILANGATTAQAWTQWWTRERGINNTPPVPLPSPFTVAPGNQVLSVLTAIDPTTVVCVMVNLSNQPPTAMPVKATAPPVNLPNGTTVMPEIAGATAEWIVERPAIPGQSPPTLYNFPDYHKTEFNSCVAVEGDSVNITSLLIGMPQELEGERLIRMFDVLQNPERTAFISMPAKRSDMAVRIRYGEFRP